MLIKYRLFIKTCLPIKLHICYILHVIYSYVHTCYTWYKLFDVILSQNCNIRNISCANMVFAITVIHMLCSMMITISYISYNNYVVLCNMLYAIRYLQYII